MDQEFLESIDSTVEKIQNDQKVLANKIIKWTEVCRNKFVKVERIQAENHATFETKLENLSEEIEAWKKEEVKLSDNVTNLETEHRHVANKIDLIDDTLKELKGEIEALKKHVDDQIVEKKEEAID